MAEPLVAQPTATTAWPAGQLSRPMSAKTARNVALELAEREPEPRVRRYRAANSILVSIKRRDGWTSGRR